MGKLLQYGTESVTEFLRGGFDKFSEGLPTIDGLADFADRFRRVSEVADRVNQNPNVAIFLSGNANLVGKVLEGGGDAVDSLSVILSRPGTVANDLATLLRTTDINPSEIQTLLNIPDVSVTQLNNLRNQSGDVIDLLKAELGGAHSIERHGSQLSSIAMEQRVLGTSPTLPQSSSALRFVDDSVHRNAVNQAYQSLEADVKAHFLAGGKYREWIYDYGQPTGFGFTNVGTRKNPIAQPVNIGDTTRVTISFDVDPASLTGFRLVSSFPVYP